MVEPAAKHALSPSFDLSKVYEQYKGVLKGAKEGEVVTRFPPEPSGYLHIGHVKAALLNYHYSKIYKGRMILRFDDTNPSKEKDEYVQSIIDDLKTLQIFPDVVTYTSDSFKLIEDVMTEMIKKGLCYCDNTPVEKMRDERGKGIESACRKTTPEENLKIWNDMIAGVKEVKNYCVRGKIDMSCLNKCMRDPVFYRSNDTPHHRTGTKFRIYPTYDFACPIVDAHEGVTHAMRTNEYSDRNAQYKWVQKAAGVRDVTIYDFSRVCMVSTCLSKRKLQWFVDSKKVDGWDDPRFPTVRGVLRRGLRVETLTEFMLEQGPSKNSNLMEWDKIFALNKKIIDPICPRYTALSREKISTLVLTNGPELNALTVPCFEKSLDLGNKLLYRSKNLLLEYEDAASLQEGEKITLMKWGNVKIVSLKQLGDKIELIGEYLPEDKDFKSTKKLSWVAQDAPTTIVHLVEYDHLLNVKKVEDDMDFQSILNENTKFITEAIAEPGVKNLEKGQVFQFERRGYYILDKYVKGEDGNRIAEMVYIPDGRSKTMSGLTNKVDVAKTAKGNTIEKPKEEKEAPAGEEAAKEKSKKEQKKEQKKADKEKKKVDKAGAGEKAPEGGSEVAAEKK